MKANVNISLHNELLQNTPYLAELLTADNKQPFGVPTDYLAVTTKRGCCRWHYCPRATNKWSGPNCRPTIICYPHGYFNQLQQNLLNEADLDADTKTIDAIVKPLQQDQQQQTQPFATPANYFNGEFAATVSPTKCAWAATNPLAKPCRPKSPFSTPPTILNN